MPPPLSIMEYILRYYQKEAVAAAVDYLQDKKANYPVILVLPTGSGKSLIIANIVKELNEPVLIFQPTKEILQQNLNKYLSYGGEATIFSASFNSKKISPVTFATIHSAIKNPDIFKVFKHIIIDECHYVNAKQGMYKKFLDNIGHKIIGLTATPFRLANNSYGSVLRFLTRTRPKIFQKVIHITQLYDLFNFYYLAKLEYKQIIGFDSSELAVNSTGGDFTDYSVQRYYKMINFRAQLHEEVSKQMKKRKNVLVFTRFVEEAEYLVDKLGQGAAIVTAQTPAKERDRIIEDFRNGKIKVVANVGILTIGFDYPELETVILARPTMSLALYYQMIGRCMRPYPKKSYSLVVDMCGNFERFGKIEDLHFTEPKKGLWQIENKEKVLTNIYYGKEE